MNEREGLQKLAAQCGDEDKNTELHTLVLRNSLTTGGKAALPRYYAVAG